MTPAQSFDPKHPDLGWQPAIPLPFMERSWRTLWRWKRRCLRCDLSFKDDLEWGAHWLRRHRWEDSS